MSDVAEHYDVELRPVDRITINKDQSNELRKASMSPGAAQMDQKERHIIPDEDDDEEEEKELRTEESELQEIREDDSTMTRVMEYLVEKVNDFTDFMGCTDSD
jgi:hypothetical protein